MGNFKNEPVVIKAPVIRSPYSYESLLSKYKERLKDESVEFTEEEKATENYFVIDTYYKQYGKLSENGSYAKKMLKAVGDDWLKIHLEFINTLYVKQYKLTDLKMILEAIYKKYGINRKPKETDLLEHGIKYTKKKIKGYHYIDINFIN